MLSRALALAAIGLSVAGCIPESRSPYGSPYGAAYDPPGRGGGGSYYAPSSPEPRGRPVHISDATYRAPDGRSCNAKRAIERMCDGRDSCRVEADNDLCGDPAVGVGKRLIVGYKCGDGRVEASVQEHKSITLSCR